MICIIVFGVFLFTYRLEQAYIFAGDQSRDTLKILRIWQEKKLTLVGPPISFTEHTPREIYLGSLYLYIGLIGLIIAKWNPIGVVLPNIFLFIFSIPLFWILIKKLVASKNQQIFALLLYVFSPVTIMSARTFWNPNLIIPASVLFWYLVSTKPKNKKELFLLFSLSGFVAGLIFNFHYLTAIPLLIYFLVLIIVKQIAKGLFGFTGFIIGILPTLIFEIRNNFYLTSAFFYYLMHSGSSIRPDFIVGINYFLDIFGSILGLKVVGWGSLTLIILTPIVVIIGWLKKGDVSKMSKIYYPAIFIAFGLTIYLSFGEELRLRYLFSIYPLLIWMITNLIFKLKIGLISYLLIIPALLSSVLITLFQPSFNNVYIPLSEISAISREIFRDNPSGNYNLTENISNDSRALSFRYFVEKDASIKPYSELKYFNLGSLYVISPSQSKIYEENRWEFSASSPWMLAWVKDFNDVKLFKFIKK